jgi:hypothetical protein
VTVKIASTLAPYPPDALVLPPHAPNATTDIAMASLGAKNDCSVPVYEYTTDKVKDVHMTQKYITNRNSGIKPTDDNAIFVIP